MSSGLKQSIGMDGPVKRLLQRAALHCAFRLNTRRVTTVSRAAGFRLIVPPTVFHPRYFLTSEFFAEFISRLDLPGKRVLDVGTGTGILALAAARAGALSVLALDINPTPPMQQPRMRTRTVLHTA